MQNKLNFNLYLVIDNDDDYFVHTIWPNLFIALNEHNVLFAIKDLSYDGTKHFVFNGTKDAIAKVIQSVFSDDQGTLDMLDEDAYYD